MKRARHELGRPPIGRGRPGPGLKVDRHHAIRLDARIAPAPAPRPRCHNYDVCGGERPVVCEVTTTHKEVYHGSASGPKPSKWTVHVSLYCVPCMHLCRQDTEIGRRRGPPWMSGAVYRRERVTWLTTLVNGEVPT